MGLNVCLTKVQALRLLDLSANLEKAHAPKIDRHDLRVVREVTQKIRNAFTTRDLKFRGIRALFAPVERILMSVIAGLFVVLFVAEVVYGWAFGFAY